MSVDSVFAAGGQLMNLGATTTPRFTITDKVWPANHGEADICLWKDDAFASVSFTIDDNTVPDHPWWLSVTETYNFPATWFIITYQVTANPSYSGPWSKFQTLIDAGHDVQSHTVTHLNFDRGFDPDDPEHDIVVEYTQSIVEIETNLTNNKVEALAYPGGTNSSYNDPALAAEYYLAARGGGGGKPNIVNKTNYMGTASISGNLYIDDGQAWNTFTTTIMSPTSQYYRGWYCMHYHQIGSAADHVIEGIQYLKQKDTEIGIWIGKFIEVAKYGQERDTATLTVTHVSDDQINFTVSDDMHDDYFTYPLTVKVRINNDWQDVTATQGGDEIEAKVIEHEGDKYALVQAVPDQGEVTLSPGTPSVITRATFYNNSAFDTTRDEDAIATDKQALLPGQTATLANYTSCDKGINGLIIDLPAAPGNITAADFTFKVGNDSDPATWASAPAPTAIAKRSGEGVNGSDRIIITFADHAIQGQWLQVTILANANTGLESPDVFYFGSAPGDTGNSTSDAIVDATDEIACRNNPRHFLNPAAITNPYDHNKDGKVDATDEIIVRNNITTMADDLHLITP